LGAAPILSRLLQTERVGSLANCGLLLNDGTSFVLLNGGFLLLNDGSCSTEPGAGGVGGVPGGVGGFSAAWARHYRETAERERSKIRDLAIVRQSKEYKRLKSQLAMVNELLLDEPDSERIKARIEELEHELWLMEQI
jgi:hypothetical protein